MLTFQKLFNFFQKQPAISLSDFSREIGKERNYMNNLLKAGKLSERQAKQLLPLLQKYGYAEDVL
jgi:chloramphenicol O-acetyltransferase